MTGDAAVREALAALVEANAAPVIGMLRPDDPSGSYPPLAAVAAANVLARVSEDVLRALVQQARDSGHTWTEIGAVLGTTRQAAQQRFSRAQPLGGPAMPNALVDADKRANAHLDAFFEGRYDDLVADFDDRMAAGLSAAQLETLTDQLRLQAGELRERGEPLVRVLQGFTTVDIPVHFERAELKARLTYDDAGRISGFYLLNPWVA